MQNAGKPLRVNCRVRKPSTRCFLISPDLTPQRKIALAALVMADIFYNFFIFLRPRGRTNPLTYKFYADIMLVR